MVKTKHRISSLLLSTIIIIVLMAISVSAVHDHIGFDDDDEYQFIENIHAPEYDHVDKMGDTVTIRREGGKLQSITFQVSSTGGHSARTYRTEKF